MSTYGELALGEMMFRGAYSCGRFYRNVTIPILEVVNPPTFQQNFRKEFVPVTNRRPVQISYITCSGSVVNF
jgi:hypothetical protein